MLVKSCRDCANFEERRDVDRIALCSENVGPYVSCEEFQPRDEMVNTKKFYSKFCIECANFEDVNGIPLCARNHTPGAACEQFKDRFEKLELTRQNNHIRTVLLIHAANKHSNPKPISAFLVEIAQKMKW